MSLESAHRPRPVSVCVATRVITLVVGLCATMMLIRMILRAGAARRRAAGCPVRDPRARALSPVCVAPSLALRAPRAVRAG